MARPVGDSISSRTSSRSCTSSSEVRTKQPVELMSTTVPVRRVSTPSHDAPRRVLKRSDFLRSLDNMPGLGELGRRGYEPHGLDAVVDDGLGLPAFGRRVGRARLRDDALGVERADGLREGITLALLGAALAAQR